VYVEKEPAATTASQPASCRDSWSPGRLGCCAIFVDLRKATGCRLVATIGHELQHTIEVLHDPSVRSGDAMYFLFARIGPVSSGPFETTAAKRTTLLIDREVCRDR
jgi:hypothetical protein